MAFYKLSDSNLINNDIHVIVEDITDKKCESCGGALNIRSSHDGIIKCNHCGHENSFGDK